MYSWGLTSGLSDCNEGWCACNQAIIKALMVTHRRDDSSKERDTEEKILSHLLYEEINGNI